MSEFLRYMICIDERYFDQIINSIILVEKELNYFIRQFKKICNPKTITISKISKPKPQQLLN